MMTEHIKNPLSGKLRGVTYEDGKIIDVHIRDTDDVVKVFVPVRRGRWRCNGDCGVTECSVCGWSIEEYVGDYAYCPKCGAKMEGGAD